MRWPRWCSRSEGQLFCLLHCTGGGTKPFQPEHYKQQTRILRLRSSSGCSRGPQFEVNGRAVEVSTDENNHLAALMDVLHIFGHNAMEARRTSFHSLALDSKEVSMCRDLSSTVDIDVINICSTGKAPSGRRCASWMKAMAKTFRCSYDYLYILHDMAFRALAVLSCQTPQAQAATEEPASLATGGES